MKRIAIVFVVAVFVPSLALAWLAVRSLRDQQLILERQQTLLYQGVADSLANQADGVVTSSQILFEQTVDRILARQGPEALPYVFDDELRTNWSMASVGFVVTTKGQLLSCLPNIRPAAQTFYADNGKFLGNQESAEVYWNAKNAGNVSTQVETNPFSLKFVVNGNTSNYNQNAGRYNGQFGQNTFPTKSIARNVLPQSGPAADTADNSQQLSKSSSLDAEFSQLVDDSKDGVVARFLQNKLNLLLWYRPPSNTNLVLGAQLSLPMLKQRLKSIVDNLDPSFRQDIVAALLDDQAKPVAVSEAGFAAPWRRPFVATELSEALPHWEMAIYLLHPERLVQTARTVKLTLSLLVAVLVIAIAAGSWLIVRDLNRQLTLARQKTDFVSNVSHELKTPLTSIRMFTEMLVDGRANDAEKRRSYLNIIVAETSRLTRLINNVLDFARMERGEKNYHFRETDFCALVREVVETLRPHLEANGFKIEVSLPDKPIMVKGDRDALAQVVLNLMSNAEKYSGEKKEITLCARTPDAFANMMELAIMDRGIGVPRGSEEMIFEKFHRAHDSLSSGIQGSGLGLTLARQIARAHGGDVVYGRRDGEGSCFVVSLPIRT